MEFISDNNTLVRRFKNLCSNYEHFKWAIAWAGDPTEFDIAKELYKNESKIEQIVVGLHFFQTSPIFIEQYMHNKNVRFLMQTDGTFHTKLYLFYNSKYEWSAIVGSSNFTKSGFHANEEANVLFTNEDSGVDFDIISQYISSLWDNGQYFTKYDLEGYNDTYNFQLGKRKNLSISNKRYGDILPSTLELMSWDDYYNNIMAMDQSNVQGRIELLMAAHTILKEAKSFNSLSADKRKALAGFICSSNEIDTPNTNWKMFGSMQGAGFFKHAINKDEYIGNALDKIPMSGPITKSCFREYCKAFSSWNDPLACATRLLAIKRPDFFVCVNSKNKKELSRLLNIPASHISLENYWSLICRIHSSVWYLDKSSLTPEEKKIKKYQVAMLDSISYRW